MKEILFESRYLNEVNAIGIINE